MVFGCLCECLLWCYSRWCKKWDMTIFSLLWIYSTFQYSLRYEQSWSRKRRKGASALQKAKEKNVQYWIGILPKVNVSSLISHTSFMIHQLVGRLLLRRWYTLYLPSRFSCLTDFRLSEEKVESDVLKTQSLYTSSNEACCFGSKNWIDYSVSEIGYAIKKGDKVYSLPFFSTPIADEFLEEF